MEVLYTGNSHTNLNTSLTPICFVYIKFRQTYIWTLLVEWITLCSLAFTASTLEDCYWRPCLLLDSYQEYILIYSCSYTWLLVRVVSQTKTRLHAEHMIIAMSSHHVTVSDDCIPLAQGLVALVSRCFLLPSASSNARLDFLHL